MASEEQVLRRLRWTVVVSVTVLFVLIVVLVFQIAIRLSNNAQINRLEAEQARLEQALQDANRDIDYFNTWQFIEDYARENLGWGRPGQGVFTRP